MKTPIDRKVLRHHLTYCWWKYLLLAVLAFSLWNIYFAVTAYRSPEDKKLEVYLYAYGDVTELDSALQALRESDFPDQDYVSAVSILPDESYGPMVLSTRMMAGEGDLLVLPRSEYQTYASQGFFLPLENWPGVMAACEAAGISLERAWRRDSETGERHLYGIPVDSIPMLQRAMATSGDCYLGIRVKCGNEVNASRLLGILLRDGLPGAAEQPELQRLCAEGWSADPPAPAAD